jgi:hypothetical protein
MPIARHLKLPRNAAGDLVGPVRASRKLRWRATLLKAALDHRRRRARLIAMLPRGGVGAEVGVWKGDFSARLLSGAKPRLLFLIDPWRQLEQEGAFYSMGQDEMDAAHRAVSTRFSRQIEKGRVQIKRESSLEAAKQLPELDWAYIDGDHRYEGVLADLQAFWTLLKPKGCLAGDDYSVEGWWEDGVTRAVEEFAAAAGCEKIVLGSQFLLRKPG